MQLSLFNALQSLLSSPGAARRASRASRPRLEPMEDRRLLSTTPLMLIDNPSVVEGTGGTSELTFNVTLTSASTRSVSVNFRTIDRTARAGSDYEAAVGSLTFAPGETSKSVTVDVVGDSATEANESLYVRLSGATNAFIYKSIGIGTIVDDDAVVAPELSINDVSMKRGLDGHRYMVFTVSLNTTNFDQPITVTASTRAITAAPGVDFDMTTRELAFSPGESTKEFAVRIYGTPTVTPDRIFYVNLTDSSVALRRPTGAGIIRYGA
jgi:hypothetical protein